MLELYCHRAQIQDGMKVVDLGCGWGSSSLFLLEFDNDHINELLISIIGALRDLACGNSLNRQAMGNLLFHHDKYYGVLSKATSCIGSYSEWQYQSKGFS